MPVLTLPADAVLRLHCDGVAHGIRRWNQEDRFGELRPSLVGAALWLATSEDELTAAIDTERWVVHGKLGEANFSVNWLSGTVLFVEWTPTPRDVLERTIGREALDLDGARAPLEVIARGSECGPEQSSEVSVTLRGTRRAATFVHEETLRIWMQSPWGRWTASGYGQSVTVPEVPLGQPFAVTWRRDDGAYGVAGSTHRGAPVEVTLRAPVVIRGRVVDTTGHPIEGARTGIRFDRRMPGAIDNDIAWSAEYRIVDDSTGAFERRLPERIPAHLPGTHSRGSLPPLARMVIDELRHERVILELELTEGATIDLGDVVLEDRREDFVILEASVLPEADSYQLEFERANGDVDHPVVELLVREPDGSARVMVERGEFPRESPPATITLWTDRPAAELVLDESRGGYHIR